MRLLFSPLALIAALAMTPAMSCSSSDDAESTARTHPPYPRDGELRLNHIQTKGTHNSYHVETPGNKLQDWRYTMAPLTTQLETQGVRQIELDVRLDSEGAFFEVYHLPFIDEGTTCRRFTECLGAVKSWSDANPGHLLVYIQIEPKAPGQSAQLEDFFAKLEAEITSVFPRERILTPDDVRGSFSTLAEAVSTRGWPTLGESRGKVMFGFDNSDAVRKAYTRDLTSLDGRLLFVDSSPSEPFAALAILNNPLPQAAQIKAALDAGMLVRTRALSVEDEPSQQEVDAALASGAQWISTDFPEPTDGQPLWLDIPGGEPARCNPVTAPIDCVASDIESPERLH